MALPTKKINKVTLPGDVNGSKTYDIVPTILSDGTTNYSATLPTLNQDSVIAVKSETKTYTGLIGTTNEYKNASFYFINVKPDSWNKEWSIIYRFEVNLDAGLTPSNYDKMSSIHECYIGGSRGYYQSYSFFNSINDTSYRPVFYNLIHETTEAGFNNNYPHKIGFELTSSTYSTDANYKRTVKVTIISTINCTATFIDTPEIPSQSSRSDYTKISSTYYPNGVNSNAPGYAWRGVLYSNGLQEAGDDNSVDVIYYHNQWLTVSSYLGLTGSTVFGFDTNGNIMGISVSNPSSPGDTINLSTTRAYNTGGFDYSRGLLNNVTGGYFAPNTTNLTHAYKVRQFDFRYTDNLANEDNTNLTMVANKYVYLRGTIGSDGLFYLAPIEVTYNNQTYKRVWTQDIPSTEDGYVYWLVGHAYSGSSASSYVINIRLYVENPLYWFKDGKFREYGPIDSDLVHKTGTETISGSKTFTGGVLLSSGGTNFYLGADGWNNELIYAPINSSILAESGYDNQLIKVESDGKLGLYNLRTPTSNTDAATKQYVDSKADNDHYPTTFTWTNGTTSGPTGSLTGNTGFSAVSFEAIPSASASQSGVVTTLAQSFAGAKTFEDNISIGVSGSKAGRILLYGGSNQPMPLNIDAAYSETNRARISAASGSGSVDFVIGSDGRLLSGSSTYGLKIPSTLNYTADKTLATTDQVANYYPIRSFTTGLQISTYNGSTNCQLYVPYATSSQYGVVKVANVRSSAITTTAGGTSTKYQGVEKDSNGKLFVQTAEVSSAEFIEIVPGTVTLTFTEYLLSRRSSVTIYDGTDNTGTVLYTKTGTSGNIGTQTVTISSGSLFIDIVGVSDVGCFGSNPTGGVSNVVISNNYSSHPTLKADVSGDGTLAVSLDFDY